MGMAIQRSISTNPSTASTNQSKPGYGKRPLWQWVLLILVVGGVLYGVVYFAFMYKGGYSANYNTTTTSTAPVATNTVSIKNMAFNPAAIKIKKGTTVTWTNQDSIPHTVVETDGSTGPNSAYLSNGQTYTFTFNETGTFHYHCSIHGFTGTVEVN